MCQKLRCQVIPKEKLVYSSTKSREREREQKKQQSDEIKIESCRIRGASHKAHSKFKALQPKAEYTRTCLYEDLMLRTSLVSGSGKSTPAGSHGGPNLRSTVFSHSTHKEDLGKNRDYLATAHLHQSPLNINQKSKQKHFSIWKNKGCSLVEKHVICMNIQTP